jgi:hypothetical protein
MNKKLHFWPTMTFENVAVLLVFAAAFTVCSFFAPKYSVSQEQKPLTKPPKGGGVQGIAMMSIPDRGVVKVPDLEVALLDSDGKILQTVKTDSYGQYSFTRQKPGKYQVRGGGDWGQEFVRNVNVGSETEIAEPVTLKPPTDDTARLIYGRVRLSDDTLPFYSFEFFGVNKAATVSLRAGKTAERTVTVNANGDFLIYVKEKGALQVQASLENAKSKSTDVPDSTFKGRIAILPTLEIENRRPRLLSVKGLINMKEVSWADGGAVVDCVADAASPNKHKLTFRWKDPSGTDALKADGNTAKWTLPKDSGRHGIYVLVEDGFGGYATSELKLDVGGKQQPLPMVRLLTGSPPAPGEFLTRKGIITADQATGYYSAIDPKGLRKTLGQWWTVNGFKSDGSADNEKKVVYLNNNDLGFGREMHFLKTGNNVAAYVTNYGNPDQLATNADDALNHHLPQATVCMEYSPIEGQTTPIVKFFVYDVGKVASSNRLVSADLDGNGQKFVPNLCMNCHGGAGKYNPATPSDVNLESSFREFDYNTYRFARPGKPNNDPSRDTPTPEEKKAFHDLNTLVLATEPTQGIKDLINGWYAGGNDDQIQTFTPTGWNGNPQNDLYLKVVGKSCRTCHVSFGSSSSPFALNWVTFDQFKSYQPNVKSDVLCGTTLFMPHAKITFGNFWDPAYKPPFRPDFLRNFETAGWAKIGTCP